MKKILIIDGNSILNRAFYGIRPLSASDGLPTNALYGFVNTVLSNMERVSPDHAAVSFDLPGKTFRHEKYDQYKANRHGMPEDLALQLPSSKKLSEAMGLCVAEKSGYEGDDIIGTLGRRTGHTRLYPDRRPGFAPTRYGYDKRTSDREQGDYRIHSGGLL